MTSHTANTGQIGAVYRKGEAFAFCRGDDFDAAREAEEIAALFNWAEQLSVEVSAVVSHDDGETQHFATFNGCGASEEIAALHISERPRAFAVYLRNPTAFHIMDFEVDLTSGTTVADCYAVARRAAFEYADALGDHLSLPVVSQLGREA